ncbi:DUF2382 domain-containing protein [Streptomyces sp. CC210A]|uniref:DUF2382 domain-containing protein n=1 Tax=Streptomyces sp. CC210A TaxID=2898184 RepID=UPI001F15806D|nr:PRC and DUF2382 domain-containing protein [Streptomyces sp. CC210A]
MLSREQVPAVLDRPVYARDGSKIGEAKHVFLDDATGQPEWVTVSTGLFGSHESFVPVRDADVVEDHLEVPYDKDKVKGAPKADVEAGGHLSADEERRLYDYFEVDWGGDLAAEGGGRDDAMTLSEESMHVGVERREAGRARLRKYVVTEEVQQTIPVRHEEVRLEREPITEANRDAALSGPEISESEHEVTLHEERPVVETRTEPVERVRLATDEYTEQETVEGRVRKERIEADLQDEPDERA